MVDPHEICLSGKKAAAYLFTIRESLAREVRHQVAGERLLCVGNVYPRHRHARQRQRDQSPEQHHDVL